MIPLKRISWFKVIRVTYKIYSLKKTEANYWITVHQKNKNKKPTKSRRNVSHVQHAVPGHANEPTTCRRHCWEKSTKLNFLFKRIFLLFSNICKFVELHLFCFLCNFICIITYIGICNIKKKTTTTKCKHNNVHKQQTNK